MKKLAVLFASMFIFAIAVQNVNAQTSADASALTSANIITPLTIVKNVDLVFGNIVPTSTEGTVSIDTDGTRSFTGGAFAFANSTGDPTAAEFLVSGEPDATYSITISNSSFTVKNADDVEMTVSSIVTSPSPTGTLTGGSEVLKVGATLTVSANQAPGLYTNADALEITVAYN